MPYVTVGQENSATIDLYEDLGTGQPIVLIHGFPSTVIPGKAGLSAAKCRVSSHTYDRRGFGNSSQPSSGYDDTFAADLNTLMTKLDLQNTVLVGFSMGGSYALSWQVAQNGCKSGANGSCPTIFVKDERQSEGVDQSVFDGIMKAIVEDRPLTFLNFSKRSSMWMCCWVSGLAMKQFRQVGMCGSSAKATLDCVPSWLTDFRDDLPRIDVPTLIIHGDADRILPLESTAATPEAD